MNRPGSLAQEFAKEVGMAAERDRSRDRNLPRDNPHRPPPSISTNSDNPKLLNSRVFIGNLPTDRVTREELEELFAKYGKIAGCSLHKGFGFVQFMEEQSAREAVRAEHMSTLKGYKIDVKMAAEGRKGPPPPRRRSPPPGVPERDGRPVPRGRGDPYERDSYDRPSYGRDRSPPPRAPPGRERSPVRRDPYEDRWAARERREDPYTRERREPYDDPYRRESYERRPPRDDPYSVVRKEKADIPEFKRESPYPADPYPRDPYREEERREERPVYECEIITVNKQLRGFGELIERRLKGRVTTELNILPDDMGLATAIDDCTRRGLLYAIVINSQNEMHRSCTVNILHGQPQEHRNMPMEEAINLISRNLQEYLAGLRRKAPPSAPAHPEPTAFLPPDSETTYLFNLLADNRQLTVPELEKVITYLNLRKNRLIAQAAHPTPKPAAPLAGGLSQGLLETPPAELGNDPIRDEKAIIEQQAELQAKILNILNGTSDSGPSNTTTSSGLSALHNSYSHGGGLPPQQSPTPSINLDNPNIQQALDNLIQSGPNLLKSIGNTGSTQAQTYTQQSGSGHPLMSSRGPESSPVGPYGNGQPRGGYGAHQPSPGYRNEKQVNQGYGAPSARPPLLQNPRPQGGAPQHAQPRFPAYGRPY